MDRESAIITPENKPFITTRFLPKTGQTLGYRWGDDGSWEKGWSIGARYVLKTISGDVIVFDRATGLMWPSDGSAAGFNNGVALTWDNAIDYCRNLSFAGFDDHDDWRLPNMFELASIITFDQTNPALEPGFWSNISTDFHWTSTTFIGNTVNAWAIWIGAGGNQNRPKTNTEKIMAVRGGSPD